MAAFVPSSSSGASGGRSSGNNISARGVEVSLSTGTGVFKVNSSPEKSTLDRCIRLGAMSQVLSAEDNRRDSFFASVFSPFFSNASRSLVIWWITASVGFVRAALQRACMMWNCCMFCVMGQLVDAFHNTQQISIYQHIYSIYGYLFPQTWYIFLNIHVTTSSWDHWWKEQYDFVAIDAHNLNNSGFSQWRKLYTTPKNSQNSCQALRASSSSIGTNRIFVPGLAWASCGRSTRATVPSFG